jgi:hypothetical protein
MPMGSTIINFTTEITTTAYFVIDFVKVIFQSKFYKRVCPIYRGLCTPSSLVRERERKRVGGREREREGGREGKKGKKERGRESESIDLCRSDILSYKTSTEKITLSPHAYFTRSS